MPIPWIFTFYSFKGGVGRSLAAANVAYTLASWGRHVLLIDMDLDAPGISGFLDRAGELDEQQTAFQPDILTLLAELIAVFRRGDDLDVAVRDLQPVSGYVRRVAPAKLAPLAPKMGELGQLDVLGIDQSRKYTERLAALGLNGLGHDELVKVSRLLRSYLKIQRFPRRPFWLQPFQPPESTPYDYVIVDSRTGFTEIGGLCVGPLADRLVVVTGLNDQNVKGTLSFLKEVGIEPQARSKDYEPWDEDDEPKNDFDPRAALGPKPTIIVASPVPAGEIEAKRKRLKEIEHQLGAAPEQISYHPQMALMESLFVRDFREEYLASQYERLTDRIQSRVGDNQDRLVMELNALLENSEKTKDWSRAVGLAMRLAPIGAPGRAFVSLLRNAIGRDEPSLAPPLHALLSQETSTKNSALTDWGRALSDQANAKQGEDADRLFTAAYEKYAEAVTLTREHANALNTWGASLSDQARGKEGREADCLFAAAYEKYADAVRLKPDHVDALSNWGNALSDQAKKEDGEDADRLFTAASNKFAEAFERKPDDAELLANWGDELVDHASALKRKEGEKADQLFTSAYEKYAEAVRLKPDHANALSNWGAALTDQAETKQGEEADRLLRMACAKFTEAVTLKPGHAAALSNWIAALADQAKRKGGEEAEQLFARAYDKYAEAVRLKLDHADALGNWGAALLDQAKRKQMLSTDREKLLDLARTNLLEAKRKGSRESLSNLARLEAIRGDANATISWLRSAIESGNRITKTKLASDPDFNSVRESADFVRFTATLPGI